jgi:hypothetical protein
MAVQFHDALGLPVGNTLAPLGGNRLRLRLTLSTFELRRRR